MIIITIHGGIIKDYIFLLLVVMLFMLHYNYNLQQEEQQIGFFLTKTLGNVCDDQYAREYTNLAYSQTAYTKFIRISALVNANYNSDEMYLVGKINNSLGNLYTYRVLQPTGMKIMRIS